MSDEQPSPRPTPAMMARKRPTVRVRTPRRRAEYAVATTIPRRGLLDAVAWPDTGVLVALGSNESLPPAFRTRYGGKVRVARSIGNEVRSLSSATAASRGGDEAHAFALRTFASAVTNALLAGPGAYQSVGAAESDLDRIEEIRARLAALGDKPGKHGGEAELIVLAANSVSDGQPPVVVLTNDAGASVVAAAEGLPSRHFGDVLRELHCAGKVDSASDCVRLLTESRKATKAPERVTTFREDDYSCSSDGDRCAACEDA